MYTLAKIFLLGHPPRAKRPFFSNTSKKKSSLRTFGDEVRGPGPGPGPGGIKVIKSIKLIN